MCGGGSLTIEARDEVRAGICLLRNEGEANPVLDGVTGRDEFPFTPFRVGTARLFLPALESLRLLFRPLGLVSAAAGATFPCPCADLLSSSSLCVGLEDLALTPQSSRSGRLPSSVSPAQSMAEGVNGRGVAGAEGFKDLSLSANPFTPGGASAKSLLICGGASLACSESAVASAPTSASGSSTLGISGISFSSSFWAAFVLTLVGGGFRFEPALSLPPPLRREFAGFESGASDLGAVGGDEILAGASLMRSRSLGLGASVLGWVAVGDSAAGAGAVAVVFVDCLRGGCLPEFRAPRPPRLLPRPLLVESLAAGSLAGSLVGSLVV